MAKHKEHKVSYIDVTSQDFAEQVLNAPQMVIVDFSSERSSSCQLFDPEFAAVSEEYQERTQDRKSTRLNSSHGYISYAVFCLKKKKLRATPPVTQTP